MRLAVTGGAGYIGSHTALEPLDAGHKVLILDNFVNASADVPNRIDAITECSVKITQLDITDPSALTAALADFGTDAVLHFCCLKAVSEAMADPLEYCRVNVSGSLSLISAMEAANCHRLFFSSSAAVYGEPDRVPTHEDRPLHPTNPYGRSKRMVEQIIDDWAITESQVPTINLRHLNPVGAHASGKLTKTHRQTRSLPDCRSASR